MRDDEPMFPSGDQDYDSAIGWEPDSVKEQRERRAKLAAKEYPDVLSAKPMDRWLESFFPGTAEDELFGPFWLRGELAILFSSAGIGKSVLATQIAESLARGVRLDPFRGSPGSPVPPQRVLYLDFELGREQLLQRYSVSQRGLAAESAERSRYSFSPDIIRTEMFWSGRIATGYDNFSEMLFDEIKELIYDARIDVVVVDNITFLDRTSTSNINTSLGLMRRLNDLKKIHFLSILVLAHTPKRKNPHLPLTEADLQGSVNLSNFADSIFALGRATTSRDLRYIKQIKVRSRRVEFDESNVAVFTMEKFDMAVASGLVQQPDRAPQENFLGLRWKEFADEITLFAAGADGKVDLVSAANRLVRSGKSRSQVAAQLGISKTTVQRYVRSN